MTAQARHPCRFCLTRNSVEDDGDTWKGACVALCVLRPPPLCEPCARSLCPQTFYINLRLRLDLPTPLPRSTARTRRTFSAVTAPLSLRWQQPCARRHRTSRLSLTTSSPSLHHTLPHTLASFSTPTRLQHPSRAEPPSLPELRPSVLLPDLDSVATRCNRWPHRYVRSSRRVTTCGFAELE